MADRPIAADAEAWLRLTLVAGVGNAALRRLLAEFGSPAAVTAANSRTLEHVVGVACAECLKNGCPPDVLEHALRWLSEPGNAIVTIADEDYPRLLLQTIDPPLVLYVKGRLDLLNRPSVAIVGSRNATPQGVATAQEFGQALAEAGVTIVSGLALGIDAAAHRGALRGKGSSIAVTGTGLDVVYPARNRDLAHELAASGALVSEFALGTPPLAGNFPRRNRVISGMSTGCLVVEAAAESGSLITARLANEQGREVFAIPGSIHSPLSKGCHGLIKQGAKLVEAAGDILEELHLPRDAGRTARSPAAEGKAAEVLEHMGYAACDLDTLSSRCRMAPAQLAPLLLDLELRGLVASMPGGLYQRIA